MIIQSDIWKKSEEGLSNPTVDENFQSTFFLKKTL